MPRKAPARRPGQAGGKRDENRRRRTQELVEAGLGLFLARGIEGVTIDDIVGEAGMAKGSFYRYFADKADLVGAIFKPLVEAVNAAFEVAEREIKAADTQERLFDAYQHLAVGLGGAILAQSQQVKLYLQEGRAPVTAERKPVAALARRITEGAVVLAIAAREHGLLRPVHPRVGALTIVGAVEKILFAFLAGEDVGPVEEIHGTIISMILDGLRVTD